VGAELIPDEGDSACAASPMIGRRLRRRLHDEDASSGRNVIDITCDATSEHANRALRSWWLPSRPPPRGTTQL